jgi:hypothetical protein
MKTKALFLSLFLVVAFSFAVGCGNKQGANNQGANNQGTNNQGGNTNQAAQNNQPKQTNPPDVAPDVKTTASIVNEAGAFEKAISNTGTWIIATVQDLTINKDLVLDGEFKNGKKDEAGKDIIQRKIALYAQDENRKVTARYTLTAPKLTVNSPNARIQSGTFKGDLYINAKNFELVDATVQGNIYFMTDEAKATFKTDANSKITGTQAIKKS